MQVLNLIAVGLALVFLVPGYIIHSVISAITPRRQDETQLLALRFLTFSTINSLLCAPLLLHIKKNYPAHPYSFANWLVAFSVLLLVPTFIGVLIAFLEDRDFIRGLFRWFRLSLLHLSPSAWDTRFKFFAKNRFVYAIVTLTDGRTVYGYFGDASVASSDTKERDLYLQKVYKLDDQGTWLLIPDSAGILISGSTIGSIEFRRDIQPCQTTQTPPPSITHSVTTTPPQT